MHLLIDNGPALHQRPVDVGVTCLGSLTILTLWSEEGFAWMANNMELEPYQLRGITATVDSRYADDIIEGMREEGLRVDDE